MTDACAQPAREFMPRRDAWTLIELLVALAIGVMIASAALSLWSTAARAFNRQREISERDQNAYAALRMLGDDLQAVALPAHGAGLALALDRPQSIGITSAASRVLLPVVALDPRDDAQERLQVVHVQYEIRTGNDGAAALWRTTREYGAAPADSDHSTMLFAPIAAFDVQISTNGRSWTNCVTLRPGSACPAAARVRLAWMTGPDTTQTVDSTVAIPVGQSYSAPAANRNPPRRR